MPDSCSDRLSNHLTPQEHFHCQCINETHSGLLEGLSHYSQPSRVALIYAVTPESPLRVFDPQALLSGHEPKFKELFVDSDDWRQVPTDLSRMPAGRDLLPSPGLSLTGLISFGGRSPSLFYQTWFTEHHPNICSLGPTERWLEQAAFRLSHDFANQRELYTGISGSFLREYATHAIRDHIVDEMNRVLGWDTKLRVYPILDAVLAISRTREEGAWPLGELIFVEPSHLAVMPVVARFPGEQRPSLENFKHVRKLLLAVEGGGHQLVSDGHTIAGITSGPPPGFFLSADFRGQHGFLTVNGDPICSFSDASFHATTRRAKLVHLEEALLESDLSGEQSMHLFKIVADLVHTAQAGKYGTTLVIDLHAEPVEISGQDLDLPLDLGQDPFMDLARSLCKVDGALHIGREGRLHRFACLLDGRALAVEDRARGARYNSALRFTADHPQLLVVVVSSDRPVSIIQEGVELNARCIWNPVSSCAILPPTIDEWLGEGEGE
jgi:hypothetical protein